ncbi:hypothetical protein NMG60_11034793 [Bertholletia excelsa]
MFPTTYNVCFDTIKFVPKALVIMLGQGIGSMYIKRIQEKKKKHTWSKQIMNKLLDSYTLYEFKADRPEPCSKTDKMEKDYQKGEKKDRQEPCSKTDKMEKDDQKGEKKDRQEPCSKTDKMEEDDQKGEKKDQQEEKKKKNEKKETPLLLAAKNGTTEMVKSILDRFPVAIHDMNTENKNAVLLAVEYRQPQVYQLLDERDILMDNIFRKVDKDGNSALHLAAKLEEDPPWLIPGAALQMKWEIEWYQFVKNSMPLHFFPHFNNDSQTAKDVFSNAHKGLVKSGNDWISKTSESCSVVAALIASVAFATASAVPGGTKEDLGTPILKKYKAFDIFAIFSLLALSCSVTARVVHGSVWCDLMLKSKPNHTLRFEIFINQTKPRFTAWFVTALLIFLAMLTSHFKEHDFRIKLPCKIFVALTSLIISVVSMLVSFCAGHFFVLKDKWKSTAIPVYMVTCLPVLYAMVQFPMYINTMRAMFTKVPQRSFKVMSR